MCAGPLKALLAFCTAVLLGSAVQAEISMLQQTIEEQATKDPQELIAKFRKEARQMKISEINTHAPV